MFSIRLAINTTDFVLLGNIWESFEKINNRNCHFNKIFNFISAS